MLQSIPPIASPRYQGRFAITAPELGIPYLSEAELTITAPHDRHAHAEIQVLWVVDGAMGMDVPGGQTLCIDSGCGLILLPTERHAVNFPGSDNIPARARIVDLRLTDSPTNILATFIRRLPSCKALPGDPAELATTANRLLAALHCHGDARSARILSCVWELIGCLTANRPESENPVSTVDPRLLQAEQYIADHLSQPIGVPDIAAAVGLSRSQLTRLTMRHRHVGPAEWLRNARVDRARQLLQTSTLSIKEIARVCGFVSQNHFSRVYFETTGKRPSGERAS